MGGRTKPDWGVYVGGPLDGERTLLHPQHGEKPLTGYTDSRAGFRLPHVYQPTLERISVRQWQERQKAVGNAWAMVEGGGRIMRYVQTLPEEPVPPPTPDSLNVDSLGRRGPIRR